jgi:uncharacterized protein YvpB
MVSYFHYPGPRLGIPEVWARANTTGIYPAEFAQLAENEGLKRIHATTKWSLGALATMLSAHGPIWCAGYWFGSGHVIVLTGVDESSVYFNDPIEPQEKSNSIEWFNNKLAKTVPGCMMYKLKLSEGGKY